MAKTFSKDLAENFKNLYETKERYDTIITVGYEPNVESIHAHSVILCTRSPYFHEALSDKWVKRKDGYIVLSKPNISALTFNIILKFLYCGIVDLNSQKDEIILELLVAADELLIQKLTNFIQEFLIENSCKFLQQSPIKMVHFITEFTEYKQFNKLNETYLETICEKPNLLFDSEEFLSLKEDALKLIIKCDNLDMKECAIWKKLIDWGTAQHTTSENNKIIHSPLINDKNEGINVLNNKLSELSENEDINVLNKTLSELIELIRFYQIDHKKLMPEVWKYKHLLSEHLIEDILTCFLDSDTKPSYNPFLIRWGNFKIDSELINKDIALLLTKWIDKKTIDDMTSKGSHYKFNLLFRSSLDGLSSQAFHRKCDNKGATITIAKVQNSVRFIGGYNPYNWNSEDIYVQTTDSFIFSFDYNDLKNATVSHINRDNSDYAIGCYKEYGPWFGEGPDLRVPNNSKKFWELKTKSYAKIAKVGSFTDLDYEVFQIVRNVTEKST
ncbi:btb/poz domain-containing protein 19-like [Gigaspora margarita]|uniref:Btb/poz domain-containing protein 19-like n=1 Tax=Gigaspora margarita TaxID=4874 RepID=A0A8H4A5X8_GIGMA|nr:btb/poz domain-containing protein 19-like [Gigaspora margarita]